MTWIKFCSSEKINGNKTQLFFCIYFSLFCSSEKINGNKTSILKVIWFQRFCSSEKINGNKTDSVPETTELKKRIHYRSIDTDKIKDNNEKKRIKAIQKKIAIKGERKAVLSDEEIGEAFC